MAIRDKLRFHAHILCGSSSGSASGGLASGMPRERRPETIGPGTASFSGLNTPEHCLREVRFHRVRLVSFRQCGVCVRFELRNNVKINDVVFDLFTDGGVNKQQERDSIRLPVSGLDPWSLGPESRIVTCGCLHNVSRLEYWTIHLVSMKFWPSWSVWSKEVMRKWEISMT